METLVLYGGLLVLLASLAAVAGLLVSVVMAFSPTSRARAGRIAMWSGIVLVVSAGVCFGVLPLVSG